MRAVNQNYRQLLRIARGGKTVLAHPVTGFVVLTVLIAIVLAWRAPNILAYPNFYAEDGSVFFQNIHDKGVLGAIFTPFNGYFITGLYLLCDVAVGFNGLFGHGLWTLAHAFSSTAIFFLAAACALPYLLFSRRFGRSTMLLVAAFSALMPLPQTPYDIIGIVGQQKFTFTYIAFLLVVYRLLADKRTDWRKLAIVDAGLLLCTYTSSVTYALLPLLAIPYITRLIDQRHMLSAAFSQMIRNRGFISLVVLYVLTLPQLVYVAVHGIPHLVGYLDTPYNTSRTIEIFGNRTLLYGLTHRINGHLHNWMIVVGVITILTAAWFLLRRQARMIFFVGVYAATVASLLFVINRPGVSDFFAGYNSGGSGPDQFFFAQTLIMYLPLVLLAYGVARFFARFNMERAALAMFVLGMVICSVTSIQKFGTIAVNQGIFENYNQTFTDQAVAACSSKQSPITLDAYVPGGHVQRFEMRVTRAELCDGRQQQYQSTTQDLHLAPYNNKYVTIARPNLVHQTFTASENNLVGIQIFLSNFGDQFRHSHYLLTLRSADCRHTLSASDLPEISADNSWFRAYFDEIMTDSKGKTYCLSVDPDANEVLSEPLAIQLSAPDVYAKGSLRVGGQESASDMVFKPVYTARQ